MFSDSVEEGAHEIVDKMIVTSIGILPSNWFESHVLDFWLELWIVLIDRIDIALSWLCY